MARVKEVSEAFQQVYLEEKPPEDPVNVHLLPYPIQVWEKKKHGVNCVRFLRNGNCSKTLKI